MSAPAIYPGNVHAGFSLLPPAASSMAGRTDALFFTLAGVSAVLALALACLAIFFCVRYRSGSSADRSNAPTHANGLEWTWTIVPMLVFIGLFVWAAYDYAALVRIPAGAEPVFVVAKQWMWSVEHANGRIEKDELHVPLGKPVRLLMTSEDVIHSFYVPAFRLKQDVVPGRYESLSFTATRPGTYHLLCAEFCGTDHAVMAGGVVVMPQPDYERWLAGAAADRTMAQRGQALFREHGCIGCHDARSTVHAPDLDRLFGRRIFTQDGRVLVADENYIRDSIVEPLKDVVAGYAPIMPSFKGQLSEQDILDLVQYLRTKDDGPPPGKPESPAR
jgi:cytochrome c oxidase subunit 2